MPITNRIKWMITCEKRLAFRASYPLSRSRNHSRIQSSLLMRVRFQGDPVTSLKEWWNNDNNSGALVFALDEGFMKSLWCQIEVRCKILCPSRSCLFKGTALDSKTFKPFVKGLDNDRRGHYNALCAIINGYGSQHEGNLRF